MRKTTIGLLMFAAAVPWACGSDVAVAPPAVGGMGGMGGAGGAEDGGGGSGFMLMPQSCPPGTVAQTLDSDGNLVCGTIDTAVREAVNRRCHVFYGWRDSCNGCSDDPAKLGRVNGVSCNPISGSDNSCSAVNLDGVTMQMFGLNTDGDVNGDDKFYVGYQCDALDGMRKGAPCEADELLAGVDEDGAFRCVSLAALVTEHLRNDCRLYLGWRDSCDGCNTAPAKWGYVDGVTDGDGCVDGAGADNTCKVITVGPWDINVIGINTDGNVNGDDKFYLGLRCDAPAEQSDSMMGSCPDGMAVVAVNADGSLQCESPLAAADQVIADSCYLFSGWRDSCNGCSTPPIKWQGATQAACSAPGSGADNSCFETALDGDSVRLVGLNPDGDVDGNDKFYLGMRCVPPPAP